jgi:hypothetical protein
MRILGMITLGLMIACGKKDIAKIKPILEPLPGQDSGNNQAPPKPLPKCNIYCNDSKNIFPKFDNYRFLSFTNFGYRGIGRCRGHAIITQQLAHLVHFENEKCIDKNQCALNALDKIKEALKFKAVKIKGFQNLYELSQNQLIKNYLMMRVRSIGHKYSARSLNVSDRYSDIREINLFYHFKDQVMSGFSPYIAVKGERLGHHALLAYDFNRNEFGQVLCVKDSNYIPNDGLECKSFIYHDQNGVYYKRADLSPQRLFIFNAFTDDSLRYQKYIDAQKKFCFETAPKFGECAL